MNKPCMNATYINFAKMAKNANLTKQMNTMMMLTSDLQVYSHVSDFSWADVKRKHQTEWQLFSKEKY